MKSALIIGIDSTIGCALQNELHANGWYVFGTSRRKEYVRKNVFYLDLANLKELRFEPQVDVVFLCASITRLSSCRDNPEFCRKVNVNAQVQISDHFLSKGACIVFLSTSAVFNGERPAYKVCDETSPITTYGESKAIAEKALLEMSTDMTIVRLTKVLTPEYPLIRQWITSMAQGSVIEPFYDLYVCPISINIVISCLRKIAEKKLLGIIHLSGKQDVSYDVMAQNLSRALGRCHSLIKSKSAIESGVIATEAPLYTSLNMSESRRLFDIPETSLDATLNDLYL